MVQVKPALPGGASTASLLAGIEPYRTAVAAHPQERHTIASSAAWTPCSPL
jgi:hypothetical protein